MPPKKGQKMDLASFLGPNIGGDWADDIDLPTAPAAAFDRPAPTAALVQNSNNTSTASFDISTVPHDPPYVAYVGNLSFNVTEHDLETFFGDALVKSVRLIMDLDTQRPKGFGYVEFMDRESLLSALAMNGESLQKRSVRINVAEGRKLKLILEKSRAPRHDDPKFASDWRRPPGNADRSFRDQFSSRGNSDRVGSFTRRDHDQKSGWGSGGAFQKRELNSFTRPSEAERPLPAASSKPKSNPFGNAAPRDELEVQKRIEEGRKAREALENERKDKVLQTEKIRLEQEKRGKLPISKEDNVPTGQGSWRKASASKPKVFSKSTERNEVTWGSSFKSKPKE